MIHIYGTECKILFVTDSFRVKMTPQRLPEAETVIGVPIMAEDGDNEDDSDDEDDDFIGMEVFRFGLTSVTNLIN